MSNYSAIDIATAAAQGFRDGVASVANSAIPNNQDASAAPQPAPSQDVAGWIPVTERLPQIKQILSEKCTLEGRELPTLYRSCEVIWYDGKRVGAGIVEWLHGKSPLSGVTHWMPLPAAPASDKQSGENK